MVVLYPRLFSNWKSYRLLPSSSMFLMMRPVVTDLGNEIPVSYTHLDVYKRQQYDTVTEVMWVTGAALFIRLADYREVGGLDDHFFAHMEEIDLCWRLRSRGKKLVCIPQSVVYHVGGATLKKENPRKTFLNFRNNLLMLYKNLPDKELEHVLFIRGILDRVAALVFYLKKDRANARAVMQARREFEDIRYSFAASRIENIMKSTDEMIPERTHFSILMKYYLLGKKHFSQLKLF